LKFLHEFFVGPLAVAALAGAIAASAIAQPTEQIQRGQKIFFEPAGGTACATCHELAGKGTVVGPDLTGISRVSPKAIVTAIKSSRTVYVVEVHFKNKTSFPGMKVSETEFWDLKPMPPAKRTVNLKEIDRIVDNAEWKHPPEHFNLSAQDLADIVAYIKFASYGETKEVSPDQVQ
jgi:putative heme-binding domain-containing protein